MSKFKNSAGGFGDDFVWSQVEMYCHNYRNQGDPRDLVKILEVIEPFLEKDISQAIIKYIEEQPMPKLGAKRAFENEAIVKLFKLHSKTHPEKTSKEIRDELAVKFGRNSGENIRKILGKHGVLPLKAKRKK